MTTPRTQYFVAQSADGFIADRAGRLDWLFRFDGAEGVRAHYERFMEGVGALVMGAATYEFVLGDLKSAWPYGARPTWVFTHRKLPAIPGADLRFVEGPIESRHAEMLASAGGRNLWVVGGGQLLAPLAAAGLIDELHLGIAPVLLGGGAPVLPVLRDLPLELDEVTRFGMGFVELRYRLSAP